MRVSHRRAWLAAIFATVNNGYVQTLPEQGSSKLPDRRCTGRTCILLNYSLAPESFVVDLRQPGCC